MKYLKPFNESLRDKMSGKSKEDINKSLGNISSKDKLDIALEEGILWIVKEIIVKESHNNWKGHSLRYAALNGYYDIVEYLIGIGTPVNYNNDIAIRLSCKNGWVDIIKLLLKNGADVTVKDFECYNDIPYNTDEIIELLDKSLKDRNIIHKKEN